MVELDSGKRIRAQSIRPDLQSPGRIILTVGTEQIQIQRTINWSRVSKLAAPPEMVSDLTVPAGVKVLDREDDQLKPGEFDVPPEPMPTKEGRPQLRSSWEFPPPAPVPAPQLTGVCNAICEERPFPCGAFPAVPCLVPFIRDPGVVVGVRYENSAPVIVDQPVPLGSVRPAPSSEARELLVTARPFNRNGLADWNSLEVSIQGRTANGDACPVRGSLKCTLWVRQAKLVRAYAETYFEEPREITRLQQWSQFLDGSERDVNGVQKVILAMPPQSPDHNLKLGDYGLLTVDLDIPGERRLATSSDPIPLRQGGYARNRAVPDFGSSILPSESVSEGVFNSGNWPAPLSGLRPDSRRFTIQP